MAPADLKGGPVGFTSEVLELEVQDHVATLWLNRPEARNAMGGALFRDLPAATHAMAEDPSIRALVIAARGPHFCVGLDLKEVGALLLGDPGSPPITYDSVRTMQDAVTTVADLPFPVIAAVHGLCIGGGLDLIAACDIRLASGDAVFSLREARVALVSDLGSLQRLPAIIGAGHLAELAYTAKDIDAAHAARIGLVNAVCADGAEDVLHGARAMASEIAANAPLAVRGTKESLRYNDGHTIHESLIYGARWNPMHLQSHDLREAIAAFVERRPPVFTGD